MFDTIDIRYPPLSYLSQLPTSFRNRLQLCFEKDYEKSKNKKKRKMSPVRDLATVLLMKTVGLTIVWDKKDERGLFQTCRTLSVNDN